MTTTELLNVPTILSDESIQYVFVVDAHLAQVGGGAVLVDY